MLQSLTIENFKCFEHLELEGLGRFNLITGRNNVGKTSLLEALYLLRKQKAGDAVGEINKFRQHYMDEFWWKNLFYNFNDKATKSCYIKGTAQNYILDLKITPQYLPDLLKIIPFEAQLSNGFVLSDFQSTRPNQITGLKYQLTSKKSQESSKKNIDRLTLLSFFAGEIVPKLDGSGVNRKVGYMPVPSESTSFPDYQVTFISDVATPFESTLARLFNNVDTIKKNKVVASQLQKMQPILTISNVSLGNNEAIKIDIDEFDEKIPLGSFGKGFRMFFYYLIQIMNCQDQVLILDEFDTGLHYSAQKIVWQGLMEIAQEFNVQIFATTHSMECVRAFSEVANEGEGFDARLINLRKPAGDPHEALIYNKADLAELLDDGLELT